MQQQQQESDWNPIKDGETVAKFFRIIIYLWASSIIPYTRRRFGMYCFGFLEWCSVGLLCLYSVTTTPPDYIAPFTLYYWSLMVLLVWHRIAAGIRRASGAPMPHSAYRGRPYLCDVLPVSETMVKQLIEPASVAAVGLLILMFHLPLGFYIIIGAVCISLEASDQVGAKLIRRTTMNDAMIEQEMAEEEFFSN